MPTAVLTCCHLINAACRATIAQTSRQAGAAPGCLGMPVALKTVSGSRLPHSHAHIPAMML